MHSPSIVPSQRMLTNKRNSLFAVTLVIAMGILFLAGIFLVLPVAQAEEAAEGRSSRRRRRNEAVVIVPQSYRNLWLEAGNLMNKIEDGVADQGQIDAAVATLNDIVLDLGATETDYIPLALTSRAMTAVEEERLDEAEQLLRAAIAINPDLPSPHYGLAVVANARGPASVFAYALAVVKAVRVEASTFWGRHFFRANLLNGISLVIPAFFILLTLGLLYRDGNCLIHDLGRFLPEDFDARGKYLLGLVILLLPILGGLGYLATAMIWAALIFPYITSIEKGMLVAATALLLVVSPLQTSALKSISLYENEGIHLARYAQRGGWSESVVNLLKKRVDANPADSEANFILGLLHKRDGSDNLLRAEEYFNQALQRNNRFTPAIVNKGNVQLHTRRPEAAKMTFDEALESGPSNEERAIIHFNLSRLHFQQLEFGLAESQYAEAQSIDADIIAAQQAIEKEGHWNRDTIDVTFLDEDIQTDLDRALARAEVTGAGPWNENFMGLPLAMLPMAAIVLIALYLVMEFGRKAAFPISRKCAMSQTPFVPTEENRGPYCETSLNLFYKGDQVDQESKDAWKRHIRFKENVHKACTVVLTVIAPGSGNVANDNILIGAPLLLVWAIALVFGLFNGFLMTTPLVFFGGGSMFGFLALGVTAAALYVLSLLTLWGEV